MSLRLSRWLVLVLLLGQGSVAVAADGAAAAAFERLKALQGHWEGKFADGRRHTVEYRLSAGGTVLVETWQLAPGRESMTLYHLDGDRLLATHYCPQQNQPRLALAAGDDPTVLSFEFVDGTGLDVPGKSHQHAFVTALRPDGSYARSETYVDNGATAEMLAAAKADAPIDYRRIAAPDQPAASQAANAE